MLDQFLLNKELLKIMLNMKLLLQPFDLYTIIDGLKNHAVCVREYFYDSATEATEDDDSSEDPIYEGYKAVLDSKANDETLVTQCYFIVQ